MNRREQKVTNAPGVAPPLLFRSAPSPLGHRGRSEDPSGGDPHRRGRDAGKDQTRGQGSSRTATQFVHYSGQARAQPDAVAAGRTHLQARRDGDEEGPLRARSGHVGENTGK